MTSFDGLGMIPIEILMLGSQKIVEYMLDLFRSPDADPLFRTKLMVVGFESVGKTTILDCFFPLKGVLTKKGLISTKKYFRLQGSTLTRFANEKSISKVDKIIVFESREWEVTTLPKGFGIKLVPSKEIKEKEIELHFVDKETQEVWLTRLKCA